MPKFFRSEHTSYHFIFIQVYNNLQPNGWAQAKFFCSTHNDVLWTNSSKDLLKFIKQNVTSLDDLP